MTIVVRLLFSIILGICFNMGVIGIALAMGIDWTVRGIIFWVRFRRSAWKKCHVI